METIGKVRRHKLVKNQNISEIARELNLSRNTTKKYLNDEAEPAYHRRAQPIPKLGGHQEQLTAWQVQDAARPKGQRRYAQRLYEDLQRVGFSGAYDSVQRFVKHWKTRNARHLHPAPSCRWYLHLAMPASLTGAMSTLCWAA